MKPTSKRAVHQRRSKLAGYAPFLAAVKSRIRAAQVKATLAANAELIHLYWDIGRAIAAMQEKEGWGAGVIPRLARDIANDMPEVKGFSERNIGLMIAFAREYPRMKEFLPQAAAKLLGGEILRQPAAKLIGGSVGPMPLAPLTVEDDLASVQQLAAQIPWFHRPPSVPGQKPHRGRIRAQRCEQVHWRVRIPVHPRAAERVPLQPPHRGGDGRGTHPPHRAAADRQETTKGPDATVKKKAIRAATKRKGRGK